MSNGTPNETKTELEKELENVDKTVGDNQTGNPRRDKFTSLYGGEGGGESADPDNSTPSTNSTADPTQ